MGDFSHRSARLLLIALCAAALARSAVWIAAVPIFEAPDEPVHFEYAAAILGAGRLLSGREDPNAIPPPTWRGFPDPAYLEQRSGVALIVQRTNVGLPAGYGSLAWFQSVDNGIHVVEPASRLYSPALLTYYPFAYYLLVAVAMALAAKVTTSAVAIFWIARAVSAMLVVPTVAFSYGIARELHRSRRLSLALATLVAAAPVTGLVTSAVQPDALAAAGVAAATYAGLRLRRESRPLPWAAGLGVALGILAVTKYQYFVCAALAIAAMALTSRTPLRTWVGAVAATVPTALLAPIQVWVAYGAKPLLTAGTFANVPTYREALGGGPLSLLAYGGLTVWRAGLDYILGRVLYTFWGTVGWLDTAPIFGSLVVTVAVWVVIGAVTLVLTILFLLRLVQSGVRLVRLARGGHARSAWRIAFGDAAVTGYLLFTAFMIVIEADGEQGRYWYPFLLPVFLVAIDIAPRVLPWPRIRTALSRAVLAGALVFMAAFNAVAIPSIHARYYGHGRELAAIDRNALVARPEPSLAAIDLVAEPYQLLSTWRPDAHEVVVIGWGVDPVTHSAGRTVLITIDGAQTYQAVYGNDTPFIVRSLGPGAARAGFDLIIDTTGLTPGLHDLSLQVVSRDGRAVYAPTPSIRFVAP